MSRTPSLFFLALLSIASLLGGTGCIAETDEDGDGVLSSEDCDDTDATAYPGAEELCDDIDNDCDGLIDDEDPDAVAGGPWYADDDGDGFGNPDETTDTCEAPPSYVDNGDDCDDDAASVNPDEPETCDDKDNDCDGLVDDEDSTVAGTETFYEDDDGDGYGDPDAPLNACALPAGATVDDTDCDDTDAAVNPGALESCNGIDDDCDGLVDDEDDFVVDPTTWYLDADGDGYGDPLTAITACDASGLYVEDGTDCDDTDAGTWPGADERCDGKDNDCNEATGESGRITVDNALNFSELASALEAAEAGSTIRVCEGEYTGGLEIDRSLDLLGIDGAESTIVEGTGSGPVLEITDGTVTVSGLTLTGGTGTAHPDDPNYSVGGGIALSSTDPVSIESCVIAENSADHGAGLFAWTDADLELLAVTFTDNHAASTCGGLYLYEADATITSLTVEANSAETWGGGLCFWSADVTLDGATIQGNESDYGAGVWVHGGTTTASADTSITENEALSEGGGLWIREEGAWSGGWISGNEAADQGGGVVAYQCGTLSDLEVTANYADDGGGIYAYEASTLQDVVVQGNEAESGGGLFVYGDLSLDTVQVSGNYAYYGGGIYVKSGTVTETADAEITENEATLGGGVMVKSYSGLDGCTVTDNVASHGGGAYAEDGGVFSSTVIEANEATTSGGGIYISDDQVSLDNARIVENFANNGGGIFLDTCTAYLDDTTIEENVATNYGGGAYLYDAVLSSDTSDWGTGSRDNDPADVYIEESTTSYTSWGSNDSFTCSSESGSCY